MRKLAMLGVVGMILGTASPVFATDNHNHVQLKCHFMGEIKGFEKCHAYALLDLNKPSHDVSSLTDNEQDRHSSRMKIVCGETVVFEGKAEIDLERRKVVIEPKHGELPNIELPKGCMDERDDSFTSSAWLNLVEGQVRGYCEVKVRDRQND